MTEQLTHRFIYLAVQGLHCRVKAFSNSLAESSGTTPQLRCVGFSLRWLVLLQSTVSRLMSFSSCSTEAY